jgi:thioredoxin reductase (NADPH)
MEREVVVIGSGPAGLTAALYTARADLQPLVLEGQPSSTADQPGGQLMLTTEVENFPGFPQGILGPELMGAMRAQAERFGAELLTAKAIRLELEADRKRIWTDVHGDDPIEARAVIVATGAQSLMLGVPGEAELLGHGVSTCATCDGFFFRSQHIAVVGGGDSALEEALFLTKFAESVTIIHRREHFRASRIMQDRAFANPKIRIRWNAVVESVLGTDSVTGVQLRDVVTGESTTLEVTGVFVAIGHTPNTAVFRGILDMDEAGYLLTHDGTATSVPGVFAAGDVQDHVYRQAITAAGSGCQAALDVERWLASHPSPAPAEPQA